MTFKVVSDSTCDLPAALAEELGVLIVPANVQFGTESYRDGVDISRAEFYERLVTDDRHPTTAQPSVGAFLEAYREVSAGADQILSVHVSSKLSGTCSSAAQAAQELSGGPRIEVYDSLNASLGVGLLVRGVTEIARAGGSLDDAVAWLDARRDRVVTRASVATLKYLVRGGRASRLQGFFGGLLDIRPIIQVLDGELRPVDRVRSRKRMIQRFEETVAAQDGPFSLGVMYSADPADAETLAERCAQYTPSERILIVEFGPAVGSHVGPGALGIVILPDVD